jgi:PilZ domain
MTLLMTDALQMGQLDEADGSERRRGLRIAQHRPIKVLDTFGGKYFGGQTHDVSSTGLRIELPAHATVRMGEMLSIHVGLSADGSSLANRRQMIPARVVWVSRAIAGRKTMTAGVEFVASIGAQLDAA